MEGASINRQTIPEELTQRIAELTARVAELTRRVELAEGVRGNGRRDQKTNPTVHDADDSSNPIEFVTENGFSIVRPWEMDGSPPPADGKCCFRVSDAHGNEREVNVEISSRVVAETALRTQGRIQLSNSFWICCAERQLADYVSEHNECPLDGKLRVETLTPGDLNLSIRWERTST